MTTPKNDGTSNRSKHKTRAPARVGHKNDEAPSEPFRSPHLIGSPGEVTGDERTFLANGFGAHLKQLRLTRKLTQQETAGMSGISQMYLSRLERGHRRPTIDAVEALASILAPDDHETVRDHLAELAGDSLRESAQRRRKRRDSRASLRWIERLKRENDRNQGRVERLRAAGVTGMANQLEDLISEIHRQIQEREPREREALAELGDDPNEEFTPMPVYRPRRKRRSYGPR
jgi:transcriptional regulator with XRE-family HTH domain